MKTKAHIKAHKNTLQILPPTSHHHPYNHPYHHLYNHPHHHPHNHHQLVATRFVNIAYSKPAYMGSSASLLYWTAEGCVDGDAMTTCRSQLKDSWLIIDLLEPYKIEKIKFVPELNFRCWSCSCL